MRKNIKLKMICTIVPILILAMALITGIAVSNSSNAIYDEVEGKMTSELNYQEESINAELDKVKGLADNIAVVVADSYTTNEWETYEKMLTDLINTNDMVLGSGLWFEPNVYDTAEEYYGPYVYKDGSDVVTTWDYSNAEYNYFEQEYYTNAKSSTEAVITDPYYDATSGIVMSSCSTPILVDGTYIGCVTVDMELTNIKDTVEAVQVGEGGTAMLTTSSGTYLGGVDAEKLENATAITADENTSLAAAGTEILANDSGSTSYTDGGKTYLLYYSTIDGVNWKLAIKMPKAEIEEPVKNLTFLIILVAVISVIVAAVIIVLQISGITKSIVKVQKFAGELAEGNFMISTLKVKGQDEIAQMSNSLNEMFDSNREVITNISHHSGEINISSGRLKESASNLKQEFTNIEDLMTGVNSDMMNSSAATEELTASVEQVNDSTDVLADEAEQSLANAKEILVRAAEVEKSARESSIKAGELTSEYQKKLSESIEQAKVVENIGEMAKIISDIAEQITLLSLNASIEAARAGEQGKGFAVVASEIGKLAGDTATAVSSIQQTIEDVQNAFEGLADNANTLLGFVTDTVSPDYDAFVKTADQYGKDAQNFSEISEKISTMSSNIQEIMSEITEAIQNIAQSTQNTADASASIMTSMEDVSDIVEDVNDMSDQQQGISDNLTSVVRRFKLETFTPESKSEETTEEKTEE
ncbi:MAG: methyl-accepting chemotaxis protein [Lachnospiraceae bacterium]|nr:methyl-accepting chemotaxis protein [Lachnospiraceae bacterium]